MLLHDNVRSKFIQKEYIKNKEYKKNMYMYRSNTR